MELRTDIERPRLNFEQMRGEYVAAEFTNLANRFATTSTAISAEDKARDPALETKLQAARAEMAALRGRSWWRRLVS